MSYTTEAIAASGYGCGGMEQSEVESSDRAPIDNLIDAASPAKTVTAIFARLGVSLSSHWQLQQNTGKFI